MNNNRRLVTVVISCLAAFAVLLAIAVLRTNERSRENRQLDSKRQHALGELMALRMMVEMFRVDTGRYPTEDEGLVVLYEQPAGQLGWRGPYSSKPILRDPWGHPYAYKVIEDPALGDYVIKSLGADGKVGGSGSFKDVVDDSMPGHSESH